MDRVTVCYALTGVAEVAAGVLLEVSAVMPRLDKEQIVCAQIAIAEWQQS